VLLCSRDASKKLDWFSDKPKHESVTAISDPNAESFKVWAEDEKIYCPANTATLVQWIEDERVFSETFVQLQSNLRA